jgi:hypothetical protein
VDPKLRASIGRTIHFLLDRLEALLCGLIGALVLVLAAERLGIRMTRSRLMIVGFGLIALGTVLGVRRARRRGSSARQDGSETAE